jgi:peptidoglycan/LPS O-acetylase OafA/YrhL
VAKHGKLKFAKFFWNRLVRLLPALAVLLLIWLLVTMVIDPANEKSDALRSFLIAATYTANLNLDITNSLGHLWTLATEEQFYLVWPFVLFVLLKRKSGYVPVLIGVALSIAGLFAWKVLGGHRTSALLYSFGPTWFQALLVGAAAYLLSKKLVTLKGLKWFGLASAAILLVMAFVPLDKGSFWLYVAEVPLIEVAAAMLVVFLSTAKSSTIGPILKPAYYLGIVSYSAYLWNLTLRYWLAPLLPAPINHVVVICCTILAATLSWHLVEKHAMKLKVRY